MTYLKALLEVFSRYRFLLQNLVQRDIKVKYRRSALGLAWSVLNPLFMMIILSIVFSTMFRGAEIPYFPVYLLSAQLTFNFFSESTNLSMDSVISNAPLIRKVYIPKYIFPMEKVLFSCINVLCSIIPLVGVILVMRVPITPWILLFPVVLAVLMVFNLGVGMLLASLVIFFRDIKHFYSIFIMALTYLTPMFYPFDWLPHVVQIIVKIINPMYWYVTSVRQTILYAAPPTGLQWLMICSWAVLALVVGAIVFKKTQDRFILFI